MNLLVVDLDGTITKSDNLIEFSYFMILKERRIRFLLVFPLLLLLKFKLINNIRFKILYAFWIIKKIRVNYLKSCAEKFVSSESFRRVINDDVLKFINEQKDAKKIILSANYSLIAENVAKLIKIETCLAINLETKNGKYTGLISGLIPYGKEKIVVFSNFVNDNGYGKTIGIGDSKSDLSILKHLDEGYLVSINKRTNMTTFLKV